MSLVALTVKAIDKLKTALGDLAVNMSLKTRTPDAYVPGQAQTYTESTVTVKGVITKFRREEIDGTLIQAIDSLIIVFPSSTSVIPKQNDVLVSGTYEFRVIRVDPVFVGSEIAFSLVQGRPG